MNTKQYNLKENISQYGSLIFLVLVIGAISSDFRAIENIFSLLSQLSINGAIAFGMTCVILTCCIDLSVGSVLAPCTMLCASFIKAGMPTELAMFLALVIGTGLGALSGLLVAKANFNHLLQPL